MAEKPTCQKTQDGSRYTPTDVPETQKVPSYEAKEPESGNQEPELSANRENYNNLLSTA